MMKSQELFAKRARSSAELICLLVGVTSAFGAFAWPATAGPAVTSLKYFVASGLAFSYWVFLRVTSWRSVFASAVTSLLCLAGAMISGNITDFELLNTPAKFEPFLSFKMVALGVAIIAPVPLYVGVTAILLCGVLPLIEYYGFIPEEFRAHILAPDPWSTTVYAIIGLAILFHRGRETKLAESLIKTEAQRDEARKYASVFLAIRHLANTPLQMITFTAALIRRNHPEAKTHAEQLETALQKLNELNEILESYESSTNWTPEILSLDAKGLLNKESKPD